MGVRAQQKKTRRSLVKPHSANWVLNGVLPVWVCVKWREAGLRQRPLSSFPRCGWTGSDHGGWKRFNAAPADAPGASAYRQRRERDPHLRLHIYGISSVITPTPFRLCCGNAPAHRRRFVPPLRVKFSISSRNLRTILNSKTICRVRLPKRSRSDGDNCLQCGCRGAGCGVEQRRQWKSDWYCSSDDFERRVLLVSPWTRKVINHSESEGE